MSNPTLKRLRRLLLLIPAAARASRDGRGLSLERARRVTGARNDGELCEDVASIDSLWGLPGFDENPVAVYVEDDAVHVVYARGLESPLALSLPEGAMLLAALLPFERTGGPAVRSALRKLRRAIPEPLRAEADQLVRGVDVAAPAPSPWAQSLRDAIDTRREVHLDYRAVADGAVERRTVEPRVLFHRDGQWYLAAWSVAKDAEHLYRLDRVVEVTVGEREFAEHRGPSLARYTKRRLYFDTGAERDVTLHLSGPPARLALQRAGGRVQDMGDGTATAVKRLTPGNHLFGVVLGHGGDATVDGPADVREALRAHVERLRVLYSR